MPARSICRTRRQKAKPIQRLSTASTLDGTDFDVALTAIKEKRLPALKALGASRVTVVRTSARTSAAITEWPDKATRDTAERKIEEVRKSVHREDFSRMTGEMKGEIVAEV